MSFYPQVDVNPPGDSVDQGLVTEGTQFPLPFQIQRVFGRSKVYAEAGYSWREGQTDEWLASAGLTIHETRGEGAAVFSYLGLQFTF